MLIVALLVCLPLFAQTDGAVLLKRFPVDELGGLAGRKGVKVDRARTVDGTGSIEIRANSPGTYELASTEDLDVESAQLIYRAALKTRKVKGAVYLELKCRFPDGGEVVSQGIQYSLSGTVHWTEVEVPFTLRKGENPDQITLGVVIDGTGKFWIDDLRLEKRPLPD